MFCRLWTLRAKAEQYLTKIWKSAQRLFYVLTEFSPDWIKCLEHSKLLQLVNNQTRLKQLRDNLGSLAHLYYIRNKEPGQNNSITHFLLTAPDNTPWACVCEGKHCTLDRVCSAISKLQLLSPLHVPSVTFKEPEQCQNISNFKRCHSDASARSGSHLLSHPLLPQYNCRANVRLCP